MCLPWKMFFSLRLKITHLTVHTPAWQGGSGDRWWQWAYLLSPTSDRRARCRPPEVMSTGLHFKRNPLQRNDFALFKSLCGEISHVDLVRVKPFGIFLFALGRFWIRQSQWNFENPVWIQFRNENSNISGDATKGGTFRVFRIFSPVKRGCGVVWAFLHLSACWFGI